MNEIISIIESFFCLASFAVVLICAPSLSAYYLIDIFSIRRKMTKGMKFVVCPQCDFHAMEKSKFCPQCKGKIKYLPNKEFVHADIRHIPEELRKKLRLQLILGFVNNIAIIFLSLSLFGIMGISIGIDDAPDFLAQLILGLFVMAFIILPIAILLLSSFNIVLGIIGKKESIRLKNGYEFIISDFNSNTGKIGIAVLVFLIGSLVIYFSNLMALI